jgi:hypothetical protein
MENKDYDLRDFVVDAELVPMSEGTKRALEMRGKRREGFLQIPERIMERVVERGISREAWCVLCALQRLEFKAEKKGEEIVVSNKALKMFGMSGDNRRMKRLALDELVELGFVLPYVKPSANRSPRVRLNPKLQRKRGVQGARQNF